MAGNNLTKFDREIRRLALEPSRPFLMSPTAQPFVPPRRITSAADSHSRSRLFARGDPPPRSQWGQTVVARSQLGAPTPSSLTAQNGNNNGHQFGRPSVRFGSQRTEGSQTSRFGGGLGPGSWRGSQGSKGPPGSNTNARAIRPGMADVNRGGHRGGRGGTGLGNGSSSSNPNPPQNQ